MVRYVVVIEEIGEAIGPFDDYALARAYADKMQPLYECKILELRPTRVMRMTR